MRGSSFTQNEMEELKTSITDEKFQLQQMKIQNTELNTKVLRIAVSILSYFRINVRSY